MSEDLAINVRGLVKRFGKKTAVNGVDIQLPRGQVWGFLGPNGSGKTTTIRMICGLLHATEGEGECLGFDIETEPARIKALTGYMTQKFSFWTDLTIRENLEFVARLYHLPKSRDVIDQTLGDAWSGASTTSIVRRPFRRLEATPRPGGGHHASAGTLIA